MAKIVIPKSADRDISVQGVGALHPVDLDLLGEIMARMEQPLRQTPRVCSLTDVAVSMIHQAGYEQDAEMLLKLATEAGEAAYAVHAPSTRHSSTATHTLH